MFPDDRTTYALAGNPTGDPSVPGLVGRPLGTTVSVYTDSLATNPADIRHADGSTVTFGNPLQVDAYSQVPLFQGPDDDSDTLYVVITGGPPQPVYARVDDRLDQLAGELGGANFVRSDTTAAGLTTVLAQVKLAGDLLPRWAVLADGTLVSGEPPLTITNVTGTSTVTVTTSGNHGYGGGDVVKVAGVLGHVGANGTHDITVTGDTTFSLNGATGSGSYTAGGTVQRTLGGTGSINEGKWNFILDATHYGLQVRGHRGNDKALARFADWQGASAFEIGSLGGAGLLSGDVRDLLYATDNYLNRKFAANPRGGARFAGGDPAGGIEVLAIGNATTLPSANPDGTHLGETVFTTVPGVVLYAQAGRLMLLTSGGQVEDLIAGNRRVTYGFRSLGGTAALQADNCPAPTVTTPGAALAATDGDHGNQVQLSTNTSSGNVASIVASTNAYTLTRPWLTPIFLARVCTDASVANVRAVAGMPSADVSGNAGPATTGAYATARGAWWRYDTGVDGTAFWRCVTADGTNATVTTTNAGISTFSVYDLGITIDTAGTVRFEMNGIVVATHTTNVPGTSQSLGPQVSVTTLTTAARLIRFNHLTINQE